MTTIYTFNNKVLKNSANDKWLTKKEGPDYNPLNLPSNTVRVRTRDGNMPAKGSQTRYQTATRVPGTSDVYDVYLSGTDFNHLLSDGSNIVEVLGANMTGITNMTSLFANCSSLTSVPLFDTSTVTNMSSMFIKCSSLKSVPLFDTSKVTTINSMLYNCYKVESGALALYQQASTQATPPSYHNDTFGNCGRDTVTGAAELAQIPSSWGGTGA